MKDYYSALGLSPSATLADIKKAFRQQAALHHPDRSSAADAAARFRLVQAAYEVLSDPDKRKAYDDNRQRNLLDSPIDTARMIWQDYISRII
ncbi:DnaJ domain-containing protein [Rhodoferax sp.]|uniref:DnaJ domain-containing protein n=1 Tax=Rhodoferax sp. TaxID=50421 RepID=UPI0025E11ECB|nr:DnaJ domain-containing protein [Rhodoferax sp.]MCM2296519.1 DnaJ domain-containing protein [Rhodoferax sp.]